MLCCLQQHRCWNDNFCLFHTCTMQLRHEVQLPALLQQPHQSSDLRHSHSIVSAKIPAL